MRARDAFLLVMLGIVLTVAVGGYLYYEYAANNNDSKKQTKTAVQGEAKNEPRKQSGSESSTGLQVMGVNERAAAAANAQQQLPGPDDYDQYNQYANEQGVLYVDIVKGNGEEIKSGDTAVVLYKGWLTDGQLFDQTTKDEEGKFKAFSFQFGARQVIAGWEQGIAGMKAGGKRRLVIPPAFGYGEAGQGPIPGNAVLVFDVELVQIEPQQPIAEP